MAKCFVVGYNSGNRSWKICLPSEFQGMASRNFYGRKLYQELTGNVKTISLIAMELGANNECHTKS
jgi:hypothetical protein